MYVRLVRESLVDSVLRTAWEVGGYLSAPLLGGLGIHQRRILAYSS